MVDAMSAFRATWMALEFQLPVVHSEMSETGPIAESQVLASRGRRADRPLATQLLTKSEVCMLPTGLVLKGCVSKVPPRSRDRLVDLHDQIFGFFAEWALARAANDSARLEAACEELSSEAEYVLGQIDTEDASQLLEDIRAFCDRCEIGTADPKHDASLLGDLRLRTSAMARRAS